MIVKTIRNTFAHSQRIVTFDHPLIAAEFGKITVPLRKNSKHARNLILARDIKYGGETSFVSLCGALIGKLISRAIELARHKKRYYGNSAKIKDHIIQDALKKRPGLSAFVQEFYQVNQNGGPIRFASLGRIPKRIRKKGT